MIMQNNFNILDCTLRDGGYYTNWDFTKEIVLEYCKAMEKLPIDYVEVGYRSVRLEGYLGEYFYCPEYVLKELKSLMPSKKLAIILDEKNIRASDVDSLLGPCIQYISMVRIAIDPKNMERAIVLAKAVKAMGFQVAFNVMYMSKWKEDPSFLDLLEGMESTIDYFYMVDSFGGVIPQDVIEIIKLVKSKTSVPLGFHGHNNLEMALINTITAMDEGCQIVDATITGMGRGAGNLRTELLLTYLDSKKVLRTKYANMSGVVGSFETLKALHSWGTNLPYMFSGAFSLPQKQVMEWVGMNRYSLSSILNALNNQKESLDDNIKLPILKQTNEFKTAIILGGGKTVKHHKLGISKLAESKDDICIIHAGARNVSDFIDIQVKQFYAMAGFESEKLLKNIGDLTKIDQLCIYPPFPRNMGTIIPQEINQISYELESINFTEASSDSLLAISIQTALDLGVDTILLAGFDGYDTTIDQTQFILAQENQKIINDALNLSNIEVRAITPTKYDKVESNSIYGLI